MTRITRHLFALGLSVALAGSATAQTRTGGQGGGQGGGQAGGQTGGADGVGLVGETVGISQQQMTTVSNTATQQSNVLGGYYGNFMYQGKIGSAGASNPGGFGQVVYSTGTSGGMTGAGGNATGGRAGGTGATGGRAGGSTGTTGFSGGSTGTTGTTGFASTGATGGRAGGTTGTTGFGGGTTGATGGAAGGRGGQFGAAGGRGGMGGTGQTNPYTVPGDRAVNVYYRPSGVFPTSGPPLVELAQTELRGLFDRSVALPDGKTINVSVASDGIAVLKGTVANDDEKRLAIGLAAITPGVRRVNSSELKVEPKP